jgi:hypothetical protein
MHMLRKPPKQLKSKRQVLNINSVTVHQHGA